MASCRLELRRLRVEWHAAFRILQEHKALHECGKTQDIPPAPEQLSIPQRPRLNINRTFTFKETCAQGRCERVSCTLASLCLRMGESGLEVFCHRCKECYPVSEQLAAGVPLYDGSEKDTDSSAEMC